jgi:hypothetical protein
MLIYLLANAAYLRVLSVDEIAATDRAGALAAQPKELPAAIKLPRYTMRASCRSPRTKNGSFTMRSMLDS